MSKPSSQRFATPAVWILGIAVAAVTMLAGSSHLRAQHVSAGKQVTANTQARAVNAEQSDRVRADLSALPLGFEANEGQTDPRVKYVARGDGYTVFLTGNETVFALNSSSRPHARPRRRLSMQSSKPQTARKDKDQDARIGVRLVGANPNPRVMAGKELPGVTNYYLGSNPANWHEGVKQYADVSYREVYPGVDMFFHGEQKQLEFDFLVAAGANPDSIGMEFTGTSKLGTDGAGNLVLSSAAGDVVLHKPLAYQMRDGARAPVEVAFAVKSSERVALQLGKYDHDRELVIDPSLTYASYLGGAGEDEAYAIAVNSSGNAFVTGQTNSLTFEGKPAGTSFDVFVSEVNSSATGLVYTDIFGTASGDSAGNAIAVDGAGDAYVAGGAAAGFPTLAGYQMNFAGGNNDGFILKVNSAGALLFSTYLGGSSSDVINGIAVDGASPANVYVAGETQSTDFPTRSPIQGSNNSGGITGFVTKLNGTGATLAYSTYLGGSNVSVATAIALDSSANAYVAGLTEASDFPATSGVVQTKLGGTENGFVTEVKSDGSAWVYSTYLGGNGTDDALGIAVDAAGEAYVTGDTTSTNFPTANAVQGALGGNSATNVFVTKLNVGATALLFSTYYGGSQDDSGTGIALDSFGDAYVTGRTTSSDYPVSGSPFQSSLKGTSDAFVTEFSNTGFVVYSSFLGGTGTQNDTQGGSDTSGPIGAVAVDATSNAYLAGSTASTTGFPVSTGVFQPNYGGGLADGFVAKVAAAPADFSVAATPSSVSATSGQPTGTVTVTVSSVNASFGQAVTLSCGNLPTHAACQFSSSSVTPGSTAQTSNLTISTNGSSSASLSMWNGNRGTRIFLALLLPVFGIMLGSAGAGSRRKGLAGWLVLGCILTALITLPACGGSSSGGGGGGSNTSPGTYNITVTGTAGSSTHSAPLVLTVN